MCWCQVYIEFSCAARTIDWRSDSNGSERRKKRSRPVKRFWSRSPADLLSATEDLLQPWAINSDRIALAAQMLFREDLQLARGLESRLGTLDAIRKMMKYYRRPLEGDVGSLRKFRRPS